MHIQVWNDELNVDLDFRSKRNEIAKTPDSESVTIELDLEKQKQDALDAVYVLMGHESGPLFWAIQDIAAKAFRAGQNMIKYK